MKRLWADDRIQRLERVIESQSKRITALEAELKLINPDSYLAKVEGYAAGYHDGAEEIARLREVIADLMADDQ